jgi:hypothetical protein
MLTRVSMKIGGGVTPGRASVQALAYVKEGIPCRVGAGRPGSHHTAQGSSLIDIRIKSMDQNKSNTDTTSQHFWGCKISVIPAFGPIFGILSNDIKTS